MKHCLLIILVLGLFSCVTSRDVSDRQVRRKMSKIQKNKYTLKIDELERQLVKEKSLHAEQVFLFKKKHDIDQKNTAALKEKIQTLSQELAEFRAQKEMQNNNQVLWSAPKETKPKALLNPVSQEAPIHTIKRVVKKKKKSRLRYAMEHIEQKRFRNAEVLLKEIIGDKEATKSRVERSYSLLGMMYYNEKRYKEAVLTFNAMIDKFPQSKNVAMAWFGGAVSLRQMGKIQDAKLFFEETKKRFPESIQAKEARKILEDNISNPIDLFAKFPLKK